MADRIEEIGAESEKRRNQALEAWAASIYAEGARQVGAIGATEESGGSGGSSAPKDNVLISQAAMDKKRVKGVKESAEAARLEAQRTKDTAQIGQQPEIPVVEQPQQSARVEARQTRDIKTQATERQQNEVRQTAAREEVREQAQVASEEAQQETLETRPPVALPLGNTKEAADQRVMAANLTGMDRVERSGEASDSADEADIPVIASPEDAARLAALKSGHGADPNLVASAYVLASTMPGISGTLQAGLVQDFVIAL